MAVIRRMGRIEDDFTMIPNAFARDDSISARAKAVYLYVASHDSGWSLNSRSLATVLGMSQNTINKALRELEDLGWLRRTQELVDGSKFSSMVYEVFTVPQNLRRVTQKVVTQNVVTENLSHIKKTNSFKKTNTTKNTNTRAREIDPNWKPDDLQMKRLRDRYPQHALEDELKKFIDWYQQRGIERKDWYRSFDNWLKKAKPERPKFSTVDIPDPYGLENAPF